MPKNNSKAQAGLEYLMTYGWALIMIAAVVGVLVFLVGAPAVQTSFSSSDSAKILLKGSSVEGTTATAILQNITGGKLTSVDVGDETGNVSGCSLDAGSEVSAGATMALTCTVGASPSGTATITYKDFAGLEKQATINIGGGTGGSTGPDLGTPITLCPYTITEGENYTLPAGGLGCSLVPGDNAITIGKDNVTIDCGGKKITGGGPGNLGVLSLYYNNITIKNCEFEGFEGGIYFVGSTGGEASNNIINNAILGGVNLYEGTSGITVSGNTITCSNYAALQLNNSSDNIIIGNTVSGSCTGLSIDTSSRNNTISNNDFCTSHPTRQIRCIADFGLFWNNNGVNNKADLSKVDDCCRADSYNPNCQYKNDIKTVPC